MYNRHGANQNEKTSLLTTQSYSQCTVQCTDQCKIVLINQSFKRKKNVITSTSHSPKYIYI